MSVEVNREEMIRSLEAVRPGVSKREILEQSNCIVFAKRRMFTFNDEVYCAAASPLGNGFVGAVRAEKLIELLQNMPDENLTVSQGEGELILKGAGKGGRRAGVRMEREIALSTEDLEKPEEWRPLHEDFCDAVATVERCAASDQGEFKLTCVHVHPKFIEATDDRQLCRWRMRTGFVESVLVRRDSLRAIAARGVTEFSETPEWVHFRNPTTGLTMACRRSTDPFDDQSPYLEIEGGVRVTLPKGLKDAATRAAIFSAEDQDSDLVRVDLKPGRWQVRGEGVSGWYEEPRKAKEYEGPDISFMIAPKMLQEIVEKHNEAMVSADKLKVTGGRWAYVACLKSPDAGEPVEELEDEDEGRGEEEEGRDDE